MSQKEDFEYFLDNKEEFLAQHSGKVLAIKDKQLLGVYGDVTTALEDVLEQGHEMGSFILQKCVPGDEEEKVVFRSRVMIGG